MTRSTPLISVAMPVFNRRRYAPEAVKSVMAQQYADWELIVSDAGSTDGTLEKLAALAETDSRIRLFTHPGLSVSAARNMILREARGAFLAVLDSDDLALPERLETQLHFLTLNPSLAGVGSNIEFIDDDGGRIDSGKYSQRLTDPTLLRERQREGWNCFVHSSMLFRTGALRRVGGYRTVYRHAEDDDLFLRLMDSHDLANLPERLTCFRCHQENASRPGRTLHRVAALASAHCRLAGIPDPLTDRIAALDLPFLFGLLEGMGRFSLPVRLCWIGFLQHYRDEPDLLEPVWRGLLPIPFSDKWEAEVRRHCQNCQRVFPERWSRIAAGADAMPDGSVGKYIATTAP